MDIRRLGNSLFRIGILGLVIAVFWWAQFYGRVATGLGDKSGNLPLQCLFSDNGACGFVSGAARMMGAWAYDPVVLWISAVVAGLGLLIRSSVR